MGARRRDDFHTSRESRTGGNPGGAKSPRKRSGFSLSISNRKTRAGEGSWRCCFLFWFRRSFAAVKHGTAPEIVVSQFGPCSPRKDRRTTEKKQREKIDYNCNRCSTPTIAGNKNAKWDVDARAAIQDATPGFIVCLTSCTICSLSERSRPPAVMIR